MCLCRYVLTCAVLRLFTCVCVDLYCFYEHYWSKLCSCVAAYMYCYYICDCRWPGRLSTGAAYHLKFGQ
jgi:hypothetical protein